MALYDILITDLVFSTPIIANLFYSPILGLYMILLGIIRNIMSP